MEAHFAERFRRAAMKKAAGAVMLPPLMGPGRAPDVETYFAWLPEPYYTTLDTVRKAIRAAAPKAATEGIYYGMPAFHHKGSGLVAYAAFKGHCSLFPLSGSLIAEFAAELAGHKTSKGTIQFPVDEPLPAGLVKKIVRARVAQNEAKRMAKAVAKR
jgi:uncharacterized protein YdhG (YjbR/CyaY superfamily)